MDVFDGGEKQACLYSKKCQSFEKLLELKNSGLVVYLHKPHRADDGRTPPFIRQGGAVRGAVNTSEDVIIIYNKKNVKITTSELTSEFEKKNISCPRCRKTFEHAQELMQGVSIGRKIVMGICDHCRKKSQTTEKPFCDCDQIVKKFMYVKGEQKEDTTKYAKQLFPPEIGSFRTGATLKKQKKTRTYSDTQINLDLSSPSRHAPDVQPMFYSHTDLKLDTSEISETDSRDFFRKKSVTFIQPIEPHKSVHARISAPSLLESHTSLINHKREEIFEDIPSLDAKEALKRRHDLSLRQMMRLDKDTDGSHSVLKRPEVCETPKISPWEQMETISKYHVGSKPDIKQIPTPTKTKSNQDRSVRYLDDPNRQLQFRSLRTSQRNIQDSYFEPSKFDTKHHDKVFKKDEELKIQRSEDKISLKMKKTKQISKSESLETVGGVLKPNFSFSFPKIKEKKIKEIKVDLSSSHLIKDVQEKYAQKAEREKEKLEQALRKKLAREEKKLQAEEKKNRQAQEEKIIQAEEKKRQALENKKKQALQDKKEYAEEQKILTEKGKSKELESEPEPKKKADDREAKSDEDLGTKQKEKTNIGEGSKSDLDKKAESDKILQEKKETEPDMEALKKQAAKEKELMKKENQELMKKANQEKDANSKKKKKEKDATSEKAKRPKKAERASSDRTNLTMPKIQKSLSKEINVSVKKSKTQQKSQMKEPPGLTAAEFKKLRAALRAERLREKEERQKTIQNQSKKMPPHRRRHQQSELCPLYPDSELESDVLSLEVKNDPPKQKTDIIIGENIFKFRPRLEKTKKQDGVPIFFQKDFFAEPDHRTEEEVQIIPEATKPGKSKQFLGGVVSRERDTKEVEPVKGIIRYALSDRAFIDKGWTMLPTEKVVRKMNVYRMRPAYPEFDWFEHNKNKGLMTYDTGERLAEFDDNGRGRWYYRSGRLALDYYDAEETNAQQRFVIYSSGELDERGRSHPITILATFDYLGNGIVFDHAGKIRLKYNQTEGVVLDRAIGPATHWQWHSLNDPPVLQQVMIDTQISHKDPKILKLGQSVPKTRTENEDMLAIEFDNFIREKTKKLSQKFKPFQIKMKAMKINEHFSLKILDQAAIYLIYRDGTTNIKLNIGMLLDNKEIVDTDTAELGKVSNSFERFPARSDSLANLQASVANAQRHERQRTNRERISQPQQACASADVLTAAVSPPMRLPLISVSTRSSPSTGQCTGHCSRNPTANLYYNKYPFSFFKNVGSSTYICRCTSTEFSFDHILS